VWWILVMGYLQSEGECVACGAVTLYLFFMAVVDLQFLMHTGYPVGELD
jgi:hypothetical protein